MRQRESMLQAELLALRTRRRQKEQRTIAGAKTAALISPAAARLRDDLLALQKQREVIAAKRRELEQNKARVRPKDVATLQKAKALLEKSHASVDEVRRESAGEIEAVQTRINRLIRLQRERLERSHQKRASVQREKLEERILREELGGLMGGEEEYSNEFE